ncbi:death-on-curing protein [Ereboglobus sp. PH5-5]|uniref:type II toxin-antitoxin system death-on-curing family toxin n=1 Tax=unclassified Ereboglobus TaxID=2626932 RepID=UPI002405D7A5|nr:MULTISPECIES: type II toxin-antitoxin system death-on-curing family toxin [unclassified Ereboglobus]MDF9828436.1 death-on-curing protein [Ereboglobus sp. PH5-10]MDF9834313.1 death-on-curing protein [Ereboglobus sp. PH5-5]
MKREIAHLTVAAVEAIHDEALAAHGGAPGLRDRGMLESAVLAPQATMLGEPMIQDPVEIAAAYLYYICLNHPFLDGNKRAALGACLVFLDLNGLLADEAVTTKAADAWERFVLDVAAGKIDRVECAKRLEKLLG